jgi:hypothetical protein
VTDVPQVREAQFGGRNGLFESCGVYLNVLLRRFELVSVGVKHVLEKGHDISTHSISTSAKANIDFKKAQIAL